MIPTRVAIPATSPHVSVNRVRIIDLPGIPVDPAVRCRKAYKLFSAQALLELAREQAAMLDLPDGLLQDDLASRLHVPRLVAERVANGRPAQRVAARSIGRRLGRNLGHILAALHRGDKVNRAVRPDWTAADWKTWANIEKVWLGGGVAGGALGKLFVEAASEYLAQARIGPALQVNVSPFAREMTLLGAARYLPAETQSALCLDFGHTLVKRARVTLDDGSITEIQPLEPRPVDWRRLGAPYELTPDKGHQVVNFITDLIAETWQACEAVGDEADKDLMLCVAAYVRGGELLGNGIYAKMSALHTDVRPLLSARVQQATGRTWRIRPIHDGTAAAALHAGETHTAIILVGTALGVGMPPTTDSHLRPVKINPAT